MVPYDCPGDQRRFEVRNDIEGSPTLLDVAGAARYLSLSPRMIRELRHRRELPVVKMGRLIRFRPADLDNYINAHWSDAQSAAN
jgi:excisionase family DNA binding protein